MLSCCVCRRQQGLGCCSRSTCRMCGRTSAMSSCLMLPKRRSLRRPASTAAPARLRQHPSNRGSEGGRQRLHQAREFRQLRLLSSKAENFMFGRSSALTERSSDVWRSLRPFLGVCVNLIATARRVLQVDAKIAQQEATGDTHAKHCRSAQQLRTSHPPLSASHCSNCSTACSSCAAAS